MGKYISLCLILAITFGCLSSKIQAPSEKITKIRRIAVVPLESPPLEIPIFSSNTSAHWFGKSAFLATVPESAIQSTGRVGVMVFGIFMLMELPAELKSSAEVADSVETMLDSGEAWIPTAVLAQETANQISAVGNHDVVVIQNIQKFPGIENRERTWHGENWLGPIRAWYNEEISQFDYKSINNQRIDAILETGIMNYILSKDLILLQVVLKLIDPQTGQVLGRARAADYPTVDTEGFFENNGEKFKESFSALGAKLITEDLKSIGLLPE